MPHNDVLSQLEALAPGLPDEITRLEQQRAQIDAQIKRLRRLHAALTDTPASSSSSSPSPRKARTAKSVKQPSVGLPRQLDIAEAMLSFDGPFTAGDVSMLTGIGESQIHRVVRQFREIEFIGKAGKRPPGEGGKGHGAVLWRVLDAHAIDTLRAKVRSEGNGVPA